MASHDNALATFSRCGKEINKIAMCTSESLDNLFPKIQLKQKSFDLIKFLRIEDPVYAGKCNTMSKRGKRLRGLDS